MLQVGREKSAEKNSFQQTQQMMFVTQQFLSVVYHWL